MSKLVPKIFLLNIIIIKYNSITYLEEPDKNKESSTKQFNYQINKYGNLAFQYT